MKLINLIPNSTLLAITFKDFFYYKKNIPNVYEIQKKKLYNIIQKNRKTLFGKLHKFDRITSIRDYKKYVPISDYDSYIPLIERILNGEKNVLTSEEVLILQPTSGTTSGSKLIPYTESLKNEFQKAINVWLFDIFSHYPKILTGKHYWSISPVLVKKETKDKTFVGFEDDTNYLGWKGILLRKVLVIPPFIKDIRNIENFWYLTSYFLLKTKELAIISIWSPTFLLMILENIEKYLERLLKDIYEGKVTLPEDENINFIIRGINPLQKRAKELEKAFHLPITQRYSKIWPDLKLISCWQDGPSRYYAEKLLKIFPDVLIQGKGLIATEGIISFPLIEAGGNLPAYTSHFLEFIPDGEENTFLINELETGEEYTVIITTGGGLYRYNLKDRVKVVKKFMGLPVLEFTGRLNFSDIVGEKLEECHIRKVIERVFEKLKIGIKFVLLAPHIENNLVNYILFIEPTEKLEKNIIIEIKKMVEEGLKENFHYKYARDIGQILELKVFLIKDNGIESYIKRCLEEGKKIGDIKQVFLDKRTNWIKYFDGEIF